MPTDREKPAKRAQWPVRRQTQASDKAQNDSMVEVVSEFATPKDSQYFRIDSSDSDQSGSDVYDHTVLHDDADEAEATSLVETQRSDDEDQNEEDLEQYQPQIVMDASVAYDRDENLEKTDESESDEEHSEILADLDLDEKSDYEQDQGTQGCVDYMQQLICERYNCSAAELKRACDLIQSFEDNPTYRAPKGVCLFNDRFNAANTPQLTEMLAKSFPGQKFCDEMFLMEASSFMLLSANIKVA